LVELSNTPFSHYVYISIRTSLTTAILINRNCIRKTYTRYLHSRKIYNILVRALETGKSARLWRVFLAWNMRVRINFIFTENVRIFCLSYNVKNSKTTAKVSENCWNKCRSIHCQWYPLGSSHLYCYRFLRALNMNQVPEKLYWVHIR
jgi:hypothetical protein